ncbi:MAG: acylphosphatase [Bacteroidia bacterium]
MKRISVSVKGKVQGVFFRAFTEKTARRLGLTRYVTNLPDGSVYMEAEGSETQLNELTEACRKGPERARVDEMIILEIPLKKDLSFRIVR